MKPSEFKISIPVVNYDGKTTENYRNHYVVEKRIVSKLSRYISQILIAQIIDLNEDCVEISCPLLCRNFMSFIISEE